MSGAFDGRVAYVTGGSGGIGRALVAALAEEGAAVGVGYHAGADRAEVIAEEVRRRGGRAVAVRADLSEPANGVAALEEVEAALGPVGILCCNAGVGVPAGLDEITQHLWQLTHAVNLEAPWLLAQRLAPQMAERGWGRILFTSSVAAVTGGVVGPHYASSKAGLHGLMAWLATRFAPTGVTVNAIAPALIEGTGMLPTDPGDPPLPVGRYGAPDEVADLALALLRNGYMTGKVVLLDGGLRVG